MNRLLCMVVVVAACGPKPSAPAQHAGGGSAKTSPQASGDTPKTSGGPEASGSEHADDQCDKLIEHVVTLAFAERPADQKLNDDERTDIKLQLRTAWNPKCKAMTKRGYDCAINAQTLATLDRCGG